MENLVRNKKQSQEVMEKLDAEKERENIVNPNGTIFSDVADSFKNIAGAIDGTKNYEEKHRYNKKVIGVYGTCPSAGVSSLITELAFSFALKKYTVAIIDGHFLFPYHRVYYDVAISKSLTDKIEREDSVDDIVIKSKLNNNINYIAQGPIQLTSLLKFDEDFNSNYQKTENIINKIKRTYDIVLIDLDVELLTCGIEQALLKSCEEFIQVNIESIKNELNYPLVQELIGATCQFDAKTIVLHNKISDKPKGNIYLPYEDNFKVSYNDARSFLAEGMSTTNIYKERFDVLMEFLEADLNS